MSSAGGNESVCIVAYEIRFTRKRFPAISQRTVMDSPGSQQALSFEVASVASCPTPFPTLASPLSATYNAPALFNLFFNCLEEP
jgi:hypothetical protein